MSSYVFKVGDRVWEKECGFGIVEEVRDYDKNYPICVRFDGELNDGLCRYTYDGRDVEDEDIILFLEEDIKMEKGIK